MGKAKKIRVSRSSDQEAGASLHEQIESDRFARPSGRHKNRARQEEEDVSPRHGRLTNGEIWK